MSNTKFDHINDILNFVEESEGKFAVDVCEIKESPVGGVGVFAKQDIDRNTTLLTIPKKSIFSASNSSIANLLVDEEIDGVLASIVAFIYETTIFKEHSHWCKYLKSISIYDSSGELILPPHYWNTKEKTLLKHSTLDTLHDGLTPEEEVREGYQLAVTIANKWNEEFGLPIPKGFFEIQEIGSDSQYLRFIAVAYAISSRIFEIDAFHESALVPIADLFNHHVTEPDVHFSSCYEVCSACGESGICGHVISGTISQVTEQPSHSDGFDHQRTTPDQTIETESGYENDNMNNMGNINTYVGDDEADADNEDEDDEDIEDEDDEDIEDEDDEDIEDEDDEDIEDEDDNNSVEIVLVQNVKTGDEVFNSYGELSNSLLLARYGFCVPNNPQDVVHFSREISRLSKINKEIMERINWWKDIGYELYYSWYDLTRKSEDDDRDEDQSNVQEKNRGEHLDEDQDNEDSSEDEVEQYPNPWLSEIYVDYYGKPSIYFDAFLNLISLNINEFQALQSNIEHDMSSGMKKLVILQRRPNHLYKKYFRQLLHERKSSQPQLDSKSLSHINNNHRLACIKILLDGEKSILEKAEVLQEKR